MGLGLLGRGINVVKFLAENGAKLSVTDLKTKRELDPALKALKEYKNIKFILGEHRLSDFVDCDIVIKAAGVPLDSPYIREAKKHRIPIEMDASLFAKLAPKGVAIVGVTGTKGKSTATDLIFRILKAGGKRAFLGGNVKGMATLPLLKKVKKGDFVVLELDSWQLQGFGDAKISPHVGVFTNFMQDHLNYYRGSMDAYFRDKANIFRFQSKSDYLVTTRKILSEADRRKISRKGTAIIYTRALPKTWKLKVVGRHLRDSVEAATKTALLLGIDKASIKKAVESFTGVPGRLQYVGERKGVKFYNDTTATVPVSAINAIKTFPERKVVLLAGGADKGLEYESMARELKKRIKAVILFKGSATDKIKSALPRGFSYSEVNSMKEALICAREKAERGDIILLSPGAASFGIFKNEFDRGEQFIRGVLKA